MYEQSVYKENKVKNIFQYTFRDFLKLKLIGAFIKKYNTFLYIWYIEVYKSFELFSEPQPSTSKPSKPHTKIQESEELSKLSGEGSEAEVVEKSNEAEVVEKTNGMSFSIIIKLYFNKA